MLVSTNAQRLADAAGPPWSWVDLPGGPRPTPPWARDMHVNWMERWANPPAVLFKTHGDPSDWPGKTFVKEGPRYFAVSPSGDVAEQYWHDEHLGGGPPLDYVTTQQKGFGGRNFAIALAAGPARPAGRVILRGPWFGNTPAGFQELHWVETHRPDMRPWPMRTGYFGAYISDDAFVRCFARFLPHLRLARVGAHFEPVKPEWAAPKGYAP